MSKVRKKYTKENAYHVGGKLRQLVNKAHGMVRLFVAQASCYSMYFCRLTMVNTLGLNSI